MGKGAERQEGDYFRFFLKYWTENVGEGLWLRVPGGCSQGVGVLLWTAEFELGMAKGDIAMSGEDQEWELERSLVFEARLRLWQDGTGNPLAG